MGDIEQRERERLRFLLQERKVQMVVLKEKNVNGMMMIIRHLYNKRR